MTKNKKLIYLSSPYSHEDPAMRHLRYQLAMLTVAHFLHFGIYLYSPILHNHPIAQYRDLGTAEEWLAYDYAVLGRCDNMWVLRIPGWDTSKGVAAEMAYCRWKGIPITVIEPPVLEVPEGFRDFQGGQGRE